MKNFLLTFAGIGVLFGFFFQLSAQPTQIWDKSFGGTSGDKLVKNIPLSDGNYLLAGYSKSSISGNKSVNTKGAFDFWIVKVKPDGSKIWDKTYGGSQDEILTDAIQTSDGGYVLVGTSNSSRSGDVSASGSGIWVIRINAVGRKLWDKRYGDASLNMVKVNQSGNNLFLCGTIFPNYRLGMRHISMIKIALNTGSQLWMKDYYFTKKVIDKDLCYQSLATFTITPDGGVLLGAMASDTVTDVKTESKSGYWFLKTDANGNRIWDKTYNCGNGRAGDFMFDIKKIIYSPIDNCYYACGSTGNTIGGDKSSRSYDDNSFISNNWLIKLDLNGNKLWDISYGGCGDCNAHSDICYSKDGGVLMLSLQGYFLKIDRAGRILWNYIIEPTVSGTYDDFNSIIELGTNHYWVGVSSERKPNNINRTALLLDTIQSVYLDDRQDFWLIDFQPSNVCPSVPMQVQVTNIKSTSAVISWQSLGSGFNYQLQYRVVGTASWTQTGVISSPSVTFNLAGLRSNVTYEVQIRSKCSTQAAFTNWNNVPIINFQTLPNIQLCSERVPTPPNGFILTDITSNQATVHWQNLPDASGTVIVYGLYNQSPNTWQERIVCTPTQSFVLSPLESGKKYRVRIRTLCNQCTTHQGNSKKSNWSSLIEFTTPVNGNKESEIEDQIDDEVYLYPNPNNGQFFLRLPGLSDHNITVNVYDLSGRSVWYKSDIPVNDVQPIDISELSAGIYSLKITRQDKVDFIKLMIE